MTLQELEKRLQEIRTEGAADDAMVLLPCCGGWEELGAVDSNQGLHIVAMRKKTHVDSLHKV